MSRLAAIPPQIFWPYFAGVVLTLLAALRLARSVRSLPDRQFFFALGPICYAIPMAVFGAEHLSSSRAIMQIVPGWMPARLLWTYLVGICLIAAALSMVSGIKIRLSSILLGGMLLAFVLLIHIPNAVAKPGNRLVWIVAIRDFAFACGALTLGIKEEKETRPGERVLQIIQWLLAAIAVFFAVEHFQHPECVPGVPLEKVIPAWMPLGRLWTYVTGFALAIGGVAMVVGRTKQFAATALGVLVIVLVLFLYVPLMVAKPDVESLNYVTDTLVYAGTFLAIASAMPSYIRSTHSVTSPRLQVPRVGAPQRVD